jgi:trans-aconitate methyltransferase
MTTPSTQRTDEWDTLGAVERAYHMAQWSEPKRSTVAFERFARKTLGTSQHVLDLGCGAGAATAYLASQYAQAQFTGLDYSGELIKIANAVRAEKAIGNLSFVQGDWFNMAATSQYDTVVSLQTISWLPQLQPALLAIFERLAPQSIVLSSLFYEGDISCRIEVTEHKKQKQQFYNVYALPEVARIAAASGYKLTTAEPFELDIDLDPPADRDVMGTYTRRLSTPDANKVERIQISGPVLMNWYMVLLEKA